jgi:PHD/YefM family antitoxin component YafN of YafNO toxin-antitoxin module
MQIVNIENFKENVDEQLQLASVLQQPINISAKYGNFVILSRAEYLGILATAEIEKNPKYKADLLEAMAEPWEDAVPESEVENFQIICKK